MANLLDYMKWRGDLSLEQDPFNEIDSLLLARFSYFPFDTIIQPEETVTIEELSKRFETKDPNTMRILWEEDADLFPLMGHSKRFGQMKASYFVNKVDPEQEKQFSAITIFLPDNSIYISYRGTDNTIVGWKEDFNMSFKSHVASQKEAVRYLETVAQKTEGRIRLGGHSKGGNLAVYAAVFSSPSVQDRIYHIFNNDGPGFDDDVIQTQAYQKMIQKVDTYIPQDSIFGRLLNHEERYTVVQSTQKGVMQHDVYTWQLLGKRFVRLKEVSNGSKFIDKSIKDWLKEIDVEQREKIIDIVFEILNSTQAETMGEIRSNLISNATTILKSYKQVDVKDRKMIMATVKALLIVAKDNFMQEYELSRKNP